MHNQRQNEEGYTYETTSSRVAMAVLNQDDSEEHKQPTGESDRLTGIQCPGKI